MGKVDCFEIPGLRLTFMSADHLPEHFHADEPGEWGIRVFFLTCTEIHLD